MARKQIHVSGLQFVPALTIRGAARLTAFAPTMVDQIAMVAGPRIVDLQQEHDVLDQLRPVDPSASDALVEAPIDIKNDI